MSDCSPRIRSGRSVLVLAALPLLILITVALMANAGVSIAGEAHAVPVTVASNVAPGVWSESNSCGSAISPALNTNQLAFSGGQCDITFGITNATSNLFLVGDAAFWNQAGAFYTPHGGAACAANLPMQNFGFKVGTAGEGLTASVSGAGCVAEALPVDGGAVAANGTEWRAINTTPVQACSSPTIGTKVCPISFGVQGNTVTPPPASTYTGTFTFTAT